MSLRSAVLTSNGTWRCPTGVSFVWVNQVGAGGGGGGQSAIAGGSADGGGAGEFYLGVTTPVVPDTQYGATIGSGGSAGTGSPSVAPGDGNNTSFASLTALGGFAGNFSLTTRGRGGGPNGGVTPANQEGTYGTAESPTAYGGASAGVRGGSVGLAGGAQIGEWAGGAVGAHAPGIGGGCGGGSSVWASGGTGGEPDPVVSNGLPGSLGSGGGGAPDDQGTPNTSDGGAGGSALLQIFWIAP